MKYTDLFKHGFLRNVGNHDILHRFCNYGQMFRTRFDLQDSLCSGPEITTLKEKVAMPQDRQCLAKIDETHSYGFSLRVAEP